MRELRIFHVDAFTNQSFGGNAAGFVPDATGLNEAEMQKIAREMNLSETAFLVPTEGDADYRIRYFTPTSEIDFCGHATLASGWMMATEYDWLAQATVIRFETNIGIVPVEFSVENGKVAAAVMTQVAPQTKEVSTDVKTVANMIGVDVTDIDTAYPIRLGYTGNWHLLVPIKTRRAIDQAIPTLSELKAHNESFGAVTTHLFTFDSGTPEFSIYTRDFAPAVGLAEDPVTGAANGALAGYLLLEGIFERGKNHEFQIGQGHAIGRPGVVQVMANDSQGQLEIKVGGQAIPTIFGTLKLA